MNQLPILIFQSAVSVLSWTKLLINLTVHSVFNQKGKLVTTYCYCERWHS